MTMGRLAEQKIEIGRARDSGNRAIYQYYQFDIVEEGLSLLIRNKCIAYLVSNIKTDGRHLCLQKVGWGLKKGMW